jgi:UDP-GlcNAc:undecaprenyl-phosphate GlcNAc-1-phosphate transferase
MQNQFIALFVICLVTSFITTPLMRFIGGRLGLLDHPHERKIQRTAIPRTGGIGILLAMGAGAIFLGAAASSLGIPMTRELGAVLVGGALIHTIGVLDDLSGLSAKLKLGAQTLVISYVMSQGLVLDGLALPNGALLDLGFLAIPLTAFFLLGFINSFNLVDGLDGLAGGIAAISAMVLAFAGVLSGNFLLAALSLALLGSVMGFLPFNFIFGKTFLGDGGSMLLGYLLAVSALAGSRFSHDAMPVLLASACAAVPALDTLTTILRRFRKRQGLFSPDSMHVHHRLIRFGLTAERTVLVILAVSAFIAGLSLCILVDGAGPLFAPTILAGILVALGMRKESRVVEDDTEASIRDIVFYLLGTLDGPNSRMDGQQRICDVLAATPTAAKRSLVQENEALSEASPGKGKRERG